MSYQNTTGGFKSKTLRFGRLRLSSQDSKTYINQDSEKKKS